MSSDIPNSSQDAHQLLTTSRELAKRVHLDQRSTWFPLMLFSLLTFLAIPAERLSHKSIGACGAFGKPNLISHGCRIYSTSGLIYWPIALVIAYVAISILYSRRSRARGAETRVEMYVGVGIGLAVLLTGASLLMAHLSVGDHVVFGVHLREQSLGIFFRLIGPSCSIGLALIVLAKLEGNRALLAFDLVYLIIVLLPVNFGWVTHGTRWYDSPNRIIDGTALFIGGVIFAWHQLRNQDHHE